MRKIFLFFLIVMQLSSCVSVKKHNEQISKLHAVDALRKDVDKAYLQLKKHHPKLYQYTPKDVLEFKFDSLKRAITTPLASRDFYKKLAPVLANVRQGHISVRPLGKQFKQKERRKLKKEKFEFYDLDFEYLENKLWVKRTFGEDSTLVAAQVIELDGESVSGLVKTYKTRFASDGYNTTLHNRFVGRGFQYFYTRDKGFLDSLTVTFKLKDSIFTKMFRRVLKDEWKKALDSNAVKDEGAKKEKPKKLTKTERRTKKLAKRKKRKDNKKYGFMPKTKEYTRNFSFIGKDSAIAYMKVRAFSNGSYKKFYKESFAKLDSAKTQHLILDLRDNGGGRIAEIERLYSYLTDKDYQFIASGEVNSRIPFLKSLMSKPSPNSLKAVVGILSPFIIAHNFIKTKKSNGKLYYKFRESKYKEPNPLNYKGKIYVLINGNSFSASSLISTNLKATNRATFVGEETGGAYNGCVAGLYKLYQLPTSKLIIRMGLMQIEAPFKKAPEGYGVKPDIEILPTVEDMVNGKDRALEWILDTIGKQDQ